MSARTSRNVVAANDSRRRRFAPDIPEEFHRYEAPAPRLTREQLARSLAKDPEFQSWVRSELRSAWSGS